MSTNVAKFSLWIVHWEVCLGLLTKAGVVENRERVVRVASQARQIEKVLGVVLQWTVPLLQANNWIYIYTYKYMI